MKKTFLSVALLALATAVCPRGLAAENPPKPPPPVLGQELFRFGTKGIGPSQMKYVQSVAVDPEGFIYTADWDLDRVQRFSPTGQLDSLVYIGNLGPIACDHTGFLWVAAGGELVRYDPSTWAVVGSLANLGDGSIVGLAPRAKGGVVALLDNRLTDAIAIIDQDSRVARVINDPLMILNGHSLSDPFLAVGLEGDIYVADNNTRAIYRFGPDGRFISRFSSSGKGPGQFATGFKGMAVDRHGRLWVSDWDGINVFAPDGRFLQRFSDVDGEGLAASGDELYATDDDQVIKYAAGPPETSMDPRKAEAAKETSGKGSPKPVGLVAVDPQGFSYIGDPDAGRVLRFDPSGEPAGSFAIEKPHRPWTGLAVDRGGTVYVAAGDRLFRYDKAGKLLGEVRHPDGDGFFHVAPRIEAGVVASWRNAQRDDLVLVGKDGAIEAVYRNAVSGVVGEPAGDVLVAMDGWRNLYAAAIRFHTVFLFKPTGEYVNRFGSEGGGARPTLRCSHRRGGRRPGTESSSATPARSASSRPRMDASSRGWRARVWASPSAMTTRSSRRTARRSRGSRRPSRWRSRPSRGSYDVPEARSGKVFCLEPVGLRGERSMIQKMLAEGRTREAVDAVEAALPSLATHVERSRNATEGS